MARDTENLWDALFGEIGRAVADVRQKVVLEPWFGSGSNRPHGGDFASFAQRLGWDRSDEPITGYHVMAAYERGRADEAEQWRDRVAEVADPRLEQALGHADDLGTGIDH